MCLHLGIMPPYVLRMPFRGESINLKHPPPPEHMCSNTAAAGFSGVFFGPQVTVSEYKCTLSPTMSETRSGAHQVAMHHIPTVQLLQAPRTVQQQLQPLQHLLV
jgi:hypothetical protein